MLSSPPKHSAGIACKVEKEVEIVISGEKELQESGEKRRGMRKCSEISREKKSKQSCEILSQHDRN